MQQDVIKEMVEQNQKFPEIQNALIVKFGEQALGKSSIYEYIKRAKLGLPMVQESHNSGTKIDEQLLITIQQEVQKSQFFSVRSLAHKLNCCPNLVYRYLTDELHLVFKKTKWIPHSLNFSQKKNRKEMSLELFHILKKARHNAYANIITGDQSWFTYNYAPEGAWVLEDDKAPVFEKSRICLEKMMITVIWGVYGTYIIDDLPEGEHYTSTYFVEHILKPLEEQKGKIWRTRSKPKIWLHLDNCRVHNSQYTQKEMEKSRFERTPHPPYSPDIAPSDFFLFGYVKRKLIGHSFQTREALYQAIKSIIDGIRYSKRWEVFDAWATRCKWVYDHDGEYFQK